MISDHDCAKQILEIVPPVMRRIRAELRAQAASDMTVPQFRVLNRLCKHPSGNQELAEWMGVATPTMTKMIDVLVRKKWVRRLTGKGDRRKVQLEVTPAGQEKVQVMRAHAVKGLAQSLPKLSDSEKRNLIQGLEVLKKFQEAL